MLVEEFRKRSVQPELMDTEALGFAEFHDCLRTLAAINVYTFAYRPTLAWLKRISSEKRSYRPLAILDVGCGGGDMLRRIWKWSKRKKISFNLIGVDLNPHAKRSAEQTTPREAHIRFDTANIFSLHDDTKPDFIISSLFTHHLNDHELITFIQWMDKYASRGWFINDLHRHPIPYIFIKYAVRCLVRNRVVRHDAPTSVARAFTASEWRHILKKAGIPSERVDIKWFFPFRYGIACRKT